MQIVSIGVRDLMVPLADVRTLALMKPDRESIITLSERNRVSGLHVFGLLERGGSITAARNFAPNDGIDEESATGTGTGAMLCYLREYNGLPNQNVYRAEQGAAMGRPSYIYGSFRDGIVWVGGYAALKSEVVIA